MDLTNIDLKFLLIWLGWVIGPTGFCAMVWRIAVAHFDRQKSKEVSYKMIGEDKIEIVIRGHSPAEECEVIEQLSRKAKLLKRRNDR